MTMWSEWEPPEPEPSELIRRALLWLGAAYALTADLIMLGPPVLPATFVWYAGLRVTAALASLLGVAGIFAPMWREVTKLRHGSILCNAALAAALVAVPLMLVCEPLWWLNTSGFPVAIPILSLAGVGCALLTAAWPKCGWCRRRTRVKGRAALNLAVMLGGGIGPKYKD